MGKRTSHPEIDLHGFPLEAALAEVERELNHTFIQEEGSRHLKFITGWGGVLRPQVRKYLIEHPLVKEVNLNGPSITAVLEDL